MNQVVTVRLQPPDPAQLLTWLERFNAAANWLFGVAFQERCWHWLPCSAGRRNSEDSVYVHTVA
jgi:hypothetical protein